MIKKRIMQLCVELRMSVAEFEKSIGVSNGCISHISDKISINITDKIAAAHPHVNVHWIRTGVGSMFQLPATSLISNEKAGAVLDEIGKQRQMIERFQKQIDMCQQQINMLLSTLQKQ